MNEKNIKVFIDFGSSKIRLGVFSIEISKNIFILEQDCISNFSLNKLDINNSKEVIKIIRNKIKFKNLLISDDISMKSLKFSIKENTIKAFKAGCDLVLHCNAKYAEMITVAKNSPKVNAFISKKTSQFYKILS